MSILKNSNNNYNSSRYDSRYKDYSNINYADNSNNNDGSFNPFPTLNFIVFPCDK